VRLPGPTGLRARLLALLLVALAPLVLIIVLLAATAWTRIYSRAEDQAGQLARLAAASIADQIEGTRELLATLAVSDELAQPRSPTCSAFLAQVLATQPALLNVAVVDGSGWIVCSAVDPGRPVNVGDRSYFRLAMAGAPLAVGDYQVGRVTGRPTLNVAIPLGGPAGSPRGVLFAAISTQHLSDLLATADLPGGAAAVVVDRRGTIVARYPEPQTFVGRTGGSGTVIGALTAGANVPAVLPGIDGVSRLWAFAPVGDLAITGLRLAIGFDEAALTADALRSFGLALGLGTLVVVAALAFAWYGARRFVVGPLADLAAGARRLAGGDLAARVPVLDGGEIAELSSAFNEMAAALEERTVHLERLVAERTAALERSRRDAERARRAAEEAREAAEALRDQAERAREEAERAREEAERANAAKSEFLSRMSHELRTPLNAILGFAQLLDLDDLRRDQQEAVHHILSGGRHLHQLINDVLDISRIESGELRISTEPVDLRATVDEVARLLAPLAQERQVRLAWEDADGVVVADQQRLTQVLLNLVSNGIKYNRRGGQVRVAVEAAGDGAFRRIIVEDDGPGIPPALQARLFAPFERLGAERTEVQGTGLGLALSKALVEHMGGRMGVESEPGRGSRFWFELPAADAGVAARTPAPEPAEGIPATEHRGAILYIEDNPSNFRLIERALDRRPGIELIAAIQGRLGLELAREHHPNLILLDLHLPDLSGEEILARLKADPTTREIPVVILSAEAQPGLQRRLLDQGAAAFLVKPIDLRAFFELVDRYTESSSAEGSEEGDQ
jgi:signal transduction histidine kinase/CheY-like chemotaxis protein